MNLFIRGARKGQGAAGEAMAPQVFGRLVNPLPIKGGGADYAHHITDGTRFLALLSSLHDR